MKIITTSLFIAFVALTHNAYALKGGPFDFNTYGGMRGGIYQAMIYMKNGSGIARFSDGTSATVSEQSDSVVFYKGIVYEGTAFGSVDLDSKRVIGITNGTTGAGEANPRAFSGQGTNRGICNTNWRGDVISEGAVTRFEASGVAHFFGELNQAISQIGFEGAQVDFEEVDAAVTNPSGSVTNVLRQDGDGSAANGDRQSTHGEDSGFGNVGHRIHIKVYGSRINFIAPTGNEDDPTVTPLPQQTGDFPDFELVIDSV